MRITKTMIGWGGAILFVLVVIVSLYFYGILMAELFMHIAKHGYGRG